MIWIFIFLLVTFQSILTNYFLINPEFYHISQNVGESDSFRTMYFGEEFMTSPVVDTNQLAAMMIAHEFDLRGVSAETENNHWEETAGQLQIIKKNEFAQIKSIYDQLFTDIACFPVPRSSNEAVPDITFCDTFFEARTYGGDRLHEGCDLMGDKMERGYYPVVSMTEGTVEKVGWLEQGGYRLGIRSPSGIYYYYAHFYSYSRDWKAGDKVTPGTLLGFMGDSGYGKAEGTVGNFPVHLHLGIYLRTQHHEELSINPYWLLVYARRFRFTSVY